MNLWTGPAQAIPAPKKNPSTKVLLFVIVLFFGMFRTLIAQTATTASPVIAPGTGTYRSAQSVAISDSTPGATIYYTLDGSTPTTSSNIYSAPLSVTQNTIIHSMAVAGGDSASSIAIANYTFPLDAVFYWPAASTYLTPQTVSLTSRNPGTVIYFTTDGSTPTTASIPYTGPVTVSSTTKFSAIAVAPGYTNSWPAAAVYVITPPAAAPIMIPGAGQFNSTQSVVLSDATPGASIYYTTNGSAPTTSSNLYTGPIPVAASQTIQAIALVSGGTVSPLASAAYTITLPAAAPSFSLAAGQYTSVQTVGLSDATPGAAIYYTTNGSIPTASSTPYAGPISIATTQTVQAVALAQGGSLSPVASQAYTINLPAALPVISPAPGTYGTAQSVTIADATAGAVLYYTLNGTTPTTSSTIYNGPISVSTNSTLQAIALAPGGSNSPVATADYAFTAATPVFVPAGGTYTAAKTITLSASTPGAVIYYTLDGTVPTMSSAVYTGPIPVTSNRTVSAFAVASNLNPSGVASAAYTVALPATAPSISPAAGSYTTVQTVTISDATAGATIYYTTDGSTPTPASSVYAGPLSLSTSQTISAIALASGGSNSPVSAAVYSIVVPAATPVFSLAAGKYNGTQQVALSDSTSAASIYFTTNGATPTTASSLYSGPISVAATETVQAAAIANGGSLSPIAKATYTITPVIASPVITPAAGTYTTGQTVTIADSNPSAVIYYTVNGAAPNTSSPVYKGPFAVSTNSNVQAVAMATGYASSPYVAASYSFTIAAPVITPAAGTYVSTQTVSISTSTPGSSIRYTLNGTAPTSGSSVYAGPISVSSNETVEAIAIATGMNNSATAISQYTITLPAPAPTFSPATGTYLKTQSVTISCSLKSAAIYYTLDGTNPTTSSAVYSGPISVAVNEKITAMALASGGSDSPVASAAYTITLPAATPVFSLASGKYTSAQSVTLSDATAGAAIYYTTDGSTPTSASNLYTAPITIAATETMQAVALANGGSLSPVAKASYTVTPPTANPVISLASGTYNTVQTVTISDATPSAVIYYTVNGGYPTTSSPVYSGPIQATTNTSIQAIALAANYTMSGAATAQYTIVAPAPGITPSAGTFDYKATVTMSSALPGATIYYTTNGATPTTSSAVYTAPIVLSPQQTTQETFMAIAVANGYLASSASSSAFTITLPEGVLAQATINTVPQLTIPANFLGLSMDYTQPAAIMGQASTGVNTTLRTLVGNLTQNLDAPMLIRIEGDNSTAAQLQPDLEPLVEFAQALNVNYTLGVDLMNDNVDTAEAEAAQWVNGIPNNLIQAIEIGNEPDNYIGQYKRPATYGFTPYLAEFQEWQSGIQSTTGSQIGFMGTSASMSGWEAGSISALQAQTFTPVIVSQHAYLSGAAPGQTLPPDYLLIPNNAIKMPLGFAPYAAAAHQQGRIFRMGEMNSVSGGGAAGISNAFESALWAIDVMFNYVNNGMDGVNWHTGQYTNYAFFEFKPQPLKGMTVYNLTAVNPVYYGVLAFAQVAGKGAQLLPVATMSDSNVSIWATVDNTNTAHVVVINKDEQATGNVQINLPGYTTGTVRYLSAPSYSSMNGVTLGGQTFDGSTDGTIQGHLVTTTISGQDGVFTLPNMPITTAAIIDFTE